MTSSFVAATESSNYGCNWLTRRYKPQAGSRLSTPERDSDGRIIMLVLLIILWCHPMLQKDIRWTWRERIAPRTLQDADKEDPIVSR